MKPMGGLRTSQVASAADVGTETLRYYERRGLLPEPQRSLGGHRLYPAEAVTVLRVIKAAQRLGFTLHEVAELLEAGQHRHGTSSPGLHHRAAAKLEEIESKIADLTLIAQTLRSAVDAGCDDLLTCAGNECCPIPFAAIGIEPASRLSRITTSTTGDRHETQIPGHVDSTTGHELQL